MFTKPKDQGTNYPIKVLIDSDGAYVAVYRNFCSKSEQNALRQEVEPKLIRSWPIIRDGREIMQPRLNWGCGDSSIKYHKYSGAEVIIEPWTPHIKKLNDRINQTFDDNPDTPDLKTDSCLVNGYRDHRDYIGWHSDKETKGPHHVVVTVSTGDTRTFAFWKKKPFRPKAIPEPEIMIDLHGGDLCVMYGRTQELYMHSILKSKQRKGARESFTFRDLRKSRPPPTHTSEQVPEQAMEDNNLSQKRKLQAPTAVDIQIKRVKRIDSFDNNLDVIDLTCMDD